MYRGTDRFGPLLPCLFAYLRVHFRKVPIETLLNVKQGEENKNKNDLREGIQRACYCSSADLLLLLRIELIMMVMTVV